MVKFLKSLILFIFGVYLGGCIVAHMVATQIYCVYDYEALYFASHWPYDIVTLHSFELGGSLMLNILLSAYVGGYVVFLLNLRETEKLTVQNALVGLIWPLGAVQVGLELVRKFPVLVTKIKGLVTKIKDLISNLRGAK